MTPEHPQPEAQETPPNGGASTGPGQAGSETLERGKVVAEAAAQTIAHGTRAFLSWLRLAQAEAGVARAQMVRIGIAAAIGLLAVFFTWISAAVALGAALMATGMPVALALALVFLAHVLVLVTLALLIRGWSRSLGFPRTRAALMAMFAKDKA